MSETLRLFDQTGAYLRGHFRLTSGLHSPEYLQCAKVLQYPGHAARLGAELGAAILALAGPAPVPTVVAPAMGGLIIGHEVARAAGARFIFTERDGEGRMTLRRGFAVEPGERVVIVEDVITTGGSTREVCELLRSMGAEVAAAGSIIDRSGGGADIGAPRAALATLTVTAWQPDVCPLCAAGQPVVKPGSRPTA
ncbi:MAG: orotate phosphoribosyltransferase [Acidobacteria bacterium]|nr:orotate phosphoribosyltransferase [Acidobacteriota bacterium]